MSSDNRRLNAMYQHLQQQPLVWRRRQLVRNALAMAGLALGGGVAHAQAIPRWLSYPFTLGVASGVPTSDGFVIWTRLAPLPFEPGGGMPNNAVRMEYEIARDERFADVVQRGQVFANDDWAHSARVEVRGLEPARVYHYRFIAGAEVSPVGRSRTLPRADSSGALRCAVASCQHYEQGYFNAYRDIVARDPDLMFHVGDYIYESSWGADPVRIHHGAEPRTLDDYRIRHAQYRHDEALAEAHRLLPFVVTWDDHEVDNDYSALRSENLDPMFAMRRAAAYQAYFEHMPLPYSSAPQIDGSMQIYRRFAYGKDIGVFVLDDRQYRDAQVCEPPGRGAGGWLENCAERTDPQRSLLGARQEQWLAKGLKERRRWNLVVQQTLVGQADNDPTSGQRFHADGWDGYPAARRRMLEQVAAARESRTVFAGGDIHSFAASDLHLDFDRPRDPVGSEFVTTSVSAGGPDQQQLDSRRADNPHMRHLRSDERGYLWLEIDSDEVRATCRAVPNVKQRDGTASDQARFVVAHGQGISAA